MRILYVTAGFPYPLTSGYLRHYHFIRELCGRGHAVVLLSLAGADFRPDHAAGLEPLVEEVHTFATASRARSKGRKALERLRSAGGADPGVRALGAKAAELVRTQRFDAVLLSGKRTAPVLDRVDGLPVVADVCDATVSRLRLARRYAGPVRGLALGLELRRTRRFEHALVTRAARLAFASSRDRELVLAEHRHSRDGEVVPNGVDLAFWRRGSRLLPREPSVVFSGALDYPPNEDAALVLVREVMPLVWASVPDAVLTLVGRDPTPRLRRAAADPRITVTGFVEDVRPYLEQAAVFAAPLRIGAGIQNKLLEALAMEVPVVASPLAAAGLHGAAGAPPLTEAAEAEDVARAVVERLEAARGGAAAHEAGRRFVAEGFTWAVSAARLERLLDEAAARAPTVSGVR